MKNFIKFALLSFFGQGIGIIIPLAIAKIIAPSEFASFSLAIMVNSFFLAFLINSTQTPFVVHANEELKERNKINETFSVQIIFFLFSVFVFFILSVFFRKHLANFVGITYGEIPFLFLVFIGLSVKTNLTSYFLAIHKRKTSAIIEFFYNTINLLSILFFLFIKKLNWSTIFSSYLIGAVFISIICLFIIKKDLILPFTIKKERFIPMFNFSKWQIIGLSAMFLVNWGDNIVLRAKTSLENIGTYNLAYQFFKGTIMGTYIAYSYFIGFIGKNIKNNQEIKEYLYKKRPALLALMISIILILMISMPKIFNLVYGDKYLDVAKILNILLIGTCLASYSVFYLPILNVLKKYKFTQTVLLIQIAINLILDFLLIPLWGISGAAISTVIGYSAVLILYEFYFSRKILPLINDNVPITNNL